MAEAYCRDVTSGKIPACLFVRQACQRQIDDLKRAESDPSWPYEFDESKAGRVCRFLEQLPHVKGPMRGQLLKLEPWQAFIVTTVFGWVRKANQQRRFRRAYVEVPRGNGKSFLCSGIGLYGLAADGEGGADIFSAATTTEQANITRGDASAMLVERPDFAKRLGLKRTAHAIFQPKSNSTFRSLSREAKNQEGKNIHIALVDELHAHPTRELWDVVIMGAAKRTQSLIFTITTSGSDTSGICFEVRAGVLEMLKGGTPNDQLFGIVYSLDEGDDWRDPKSWEKANPNWHASIDRDLFAMDAAEAMQTASKENNFRTKHLDQWVNADVSWMSLQAWDACADPDLDEASFAGQPCVIGLDLASKVDFASAAKLFWKDLPAADGKRERHYYVFVRNYLPEEAAERSKNSQISGWVKDGWVKATAGGVLDFDAVKEDIKADGRAHKVLECGFDPWQAAMLANELTAEQVKMVEVPPNVANFSAAMKEIESLALSGRLHHTGDPALRWMISNVVCHRDAKDNVYPRKQRPENKIDAVVALITAMNRAMLQVNAGHAYESRGFRSL